MARFRDKEKALVLRKEGKSYSEIKKVLGVSKGTLSAWLRNYPLSEARIRELRDWNQQRIERYRETRRRQREDLLHRIYEGEKVQLIPLLKRDVLLAGLFLYWGEGGKTKPAELILSNSNPAVIKAFILWLEKSWGRKKKKLKVKLHLYRDMNIAKETAYWVKVLNIPRTHFTKPYIKKSNFSSLTYKRSFGHGTCNIALANAMVAKRVLMGIRVVEDHFNQ